MALADEYTLSQDTTFLQRVTMAAVRKAVGIAAETGAGLTASARKRLAVLVLKDPVEQSKPLAVILARDTVIASKAATPASIADSEITTALSDPIWDGYAQAFATLST